MATVRKQTIKENTSGGLTQRSKYYEQLLQNYRLLRKRRFLLYYGLLRYVREVMAIQFVSTAKRLESVRGRQRWQVCRREY